MTNFSPAIIAACLFVYSISLQAQVKETYQDQSDALTTIVVKEDSASDLDILQQQFDLDEVGMHQVIRITTRPDVAPAPDEVRLETSTIQEESIMVAHAEPAATPNMTPVWTAPAAVQPAAEQVAEDSSTSSPLSPKGESVTQKNQQSANSSSGYSKRSERSQKQSNFSNKRFKKEKRKRVPKRANRKARCYKF